MLIKCPECNESISDKAISCPHCGFPIVDNSKSYPQKSTGKKSRKKKRLPNGFGQITKIKGNLRNPYRAMVTVGKTEEGKPICKLLKPQSYFKTYNDAYAALVEYNKNPYEVSNDITCGELYEKWLAEYEKKVSNSSRKNMVSAWRRSEELKDVLMRDIRIRHLKAIMQDQNLNTQKRMKVLWNHLFDYAIEYEIVDKNYSRMFGVGGKQTVGKEHIIFTKEEIDTLWKNRNDQMVSIILVQCFMGWRPQELCELKISDINLQDQEIVGGIKTSAGKKRRVYVVPAIWDLVLKWYGKNKNEKYLFGEDNGAPLTYNAYRYRFKQTMKHLGLNPDHRPHDPRKHFITTAKKMGVDEYAIKKLVGHEISDVTEKIYTTRDPEWLTHEIMKMNDCMNNV